MVLLQNIAVESKSSAFILAEREKKPISIEPTMIR